jgi:hypothetical protein
MPRVQVLPYLVPRRDRVQPGPWRMRVEALEAEARELLHYWDPSMPLHLLRRLRVDISGVREDCGLAEGDRLRASIVWQSPGTTLRGCGDCVDLEEDSALGDVDLTLQLEGVRLADRIRVETQLVLARPATGQLALAPRRAGSILWRDETTVQLEGSASRFPMEWADFRDAGWLPADAGWYLDWDRDDLNRPFLGGVRLFVNSAHETVRRAAGATHPLPTERPIRDAMRWDVGRTLILGALANEDFVNDPRRYSEGSTGKVICNIIGASFPGESLESLRSRWRAEPFQFDCYLQDRLGLFRWSGQ